MKATSSKTARSMSLVHGGLALALAAWSLASAAPVLERWSGPNSRSAHPARLEISEAGGITLLRFDLSELAPGTKIAGAWLVLAKDGDQPRDPIRVQVVEGIDGAIVRRSGKPLDLEPPWYRRFVAADAVRRWVSDPPSNRGFAVEPFEGFQPARSSLDISYEGEAKGLPPQVEGVRAVHGDGQTFIVWTEHPAYRPQPGEVLWIEKFAERGDVLAPGPGPGAFGMSRHPAITLNTLRRLQGLGLRDKPSGIQGIHGLKRAAEVEPVAYRIYRHTERITSANIHQASLLAMVDPLSGLDTEVYAIHFQGEYIDQREEPSSPMPTYRVPPGDPLRPGEGLYVHTTEKDGRSYYAVTTILAGTENLAEIGPANSLAEPIPESKAPPRPVLQWIQEDQYHADPPEYWHRFWIAPPLTNLPSLSLRVAVAVSESFRGPGPLSIGTISDTFNVRGSINLPRADRVTLLVEKQLPWLPDLFMNEGRNTLRGASACTVDAFCERYTAYVIAWVKAAYAIDPARTEGDLLEFGLRHPEIFPRMSFGAYTATYDYLWAPGDPDHLGPKGIRTADGEDAWKVYSLVGYVLAYPERDIPFLICISGTGKDSGHTSEFGWQDDPRGWAALQAARQPFVASWSGGGETHALLAGVRWDLSLPAFSNCSLDNNPGNGDPADGDYYGQINGYLAWDGAGGVDEADRWEMTVWIVENCPRDRCAVDVTARHTQRFRPKRGERFAWEISTAAGAGVSGTAEADRWGLVTVKGASITKAKHRIAVKKM